MLGRRGFTLERAAAQVCREASGRVGVDRFVRDLDLGTFNGLDQRRIELTVDGLTLWHAAQLAVDNTLVSPLHGDGMARRNAATTSGVALWDARRVKERTCPELTGEGGRARLVVLPSEVGGQWSEKTADPPSFGEGQRRSARKSHPGSSHSSIRETLERFMQSGKGPSQCRCWRSVQSPALARTLLGA